MAFSDTRTPGTRAGGTTAAFERASLRGVAVLAAPVVLTQISTTVMGLVDSAMVGSLGATELAAVGLGGVWLWTVESFFVGTCSAVQTFVAQEEGAGRVRESGAWVWHGIHASLPFALFVSVLFTLGAPWLMALAGASAELQPAAVGYLEHRALGAPALCAGIAFSSWFRGVGDMRTPLYATLVANVTNAALDYALVFGAFGFPEWGVAGAGAATAVSEWLLFALMALAFWRAGVRGETETRPTAPSLPFARRLLRTGAPIGAQWFLEMTSFSLFVSVVARIGDVEMAASQAFIVLLSMSFMQAVGIGSAVSTLVGQSIGANEPAAAERAFRSGQWLALWLAAAIALLFTSVPDVLMRVFTSDPRVLAFGRPLLLLGALYQLCDAVAIVSDGALRGAGDTTWPLVVRFALAWGLFVPLSYWLVQSGGGVVGAWIGGLVYTAVLAGAFAWRFWSGRWKRIEI